MLDKRTSVAGDESDLRQQLSVAPHLSAYDELHTLPDRHDHRHHGVHRAGDGSLWLLPVDACDDYRAALLDDVPIMTIAFDNASTPEKPVRWEMKRVMAVSVVLGILAVVQSFGLMYLGKTVFGLDLAQLQTMMFLQLVAGGHLMLFVTRSETEFWRPPYPPLVGSCQCCPGGSLQSSGPPT
jgi:hypothetical protein